MLFRPDRGDVVYISDKLGVEVLHNGSKIIIDCFFLVDCSIRPYSIVAGIGRNGEHRVLVGRALADRYRKSDQTGEYICAPISDIYAEGVRSDLEKYRKLYNLGDIEIILWPELSLSQK